MNKLVLVFVALVLNVLAQKRARLTEQERIEQFHRLYKWPPTDMVESPGYTAHMNMLESEIMQLENSAERWENWMQLNQARRTKTFTPLGFKKIKTPASVQARLAAALKEGVDNFDQLREEGHIPVIHDEQLSPRMIDKNALLREIQRELLPLHEEWAGGIALKPTSVYGIRLYRNGSSLDMHCDKCYSHVISSIVHIGHEYDDDNEPWPISILGHDGVVYSYNLEPGEMLFYESAKCPHGRMTQFKGKYYASIFVHYQPVDKDVYHCSTEENINSIPPHWSKNSVNFPNAPVAGASITCKSYRCVNAPPMLTRDVNLEL